MKGELDLIKENEAYQQEMLSYLLNDDTLYFRCIDMIRPEMFTGQNRIIFDTFLNIISDTRKPDISLISQKSNIPLDEILKIYTYFTPAPVPIHQLLYNLFSFMANDKLMKLASYISSQVLCGTDYETILSEVGRLTSNLELGGASSVINMESAITDLVRTINDNRKVDRKFTGIPCGIKLIDYHMGGLHRGDLIILAGETSHGKTSLALSMEYNSATSFEIPVGIISHEMTTDELTGRLSAYATKIPSKHLLYGKLSDSELYEFNLNIPKLIRSNIFIQGTIRRDLKDTVAAIRLMVMQHKIHYVVVENAGNINVKGKNEDESRTAEISKSLKALAKELDIAIILVSHLNRELQGKKSQPNLSRLRHSGQLEADADVVIFVYRAELHGKDYFDDNSDAEGISTEGMAKVYIAKGRNVGLAQTYMHFYEQLTYFTDEPINGTDQPF